MRRTLTIGAAAILATVLTACSSSSPTSGSTTNPTANPVVATTPAAAPTTAAAAEAPDPCALVTQQEASALAGVTFGKGKLEQENAASKRCVYGGQTKNVFTVIVARGTSVDEAKAVKDDLIAQAKASDLPITLIPVAGVGDDAQGVVKSMQGVNLSALYVLSGTTGFGLVDLTVGMPAPSLASLTDQAKVVIGRL